MADGDAGSSKNEKPSDTLAGQSCPFCAKGLFELCQINYTATTPEKPEIKVKGVWVVKCSVCGEMVYQPDSSDVITRVISEETGQLAPAQLKETPE